MLCLSHRTKAINDIRDFIRQNVDSLIYWRRHLVCTGLLPDLHTDVTRLLPTCKITKAQLVSSSAELSFGTLTNV